MQVRFLIEHQGHQVGEIGEFVPFYTDDLLNRKIVEPYLEESKKDEEIKKQAAEIADLRKQLKAKKVNAAPIDKQVKTADITK